MVTVPRVQGPSVDLVGIPDRGRINPRFDTSGQAALVGATRQAAGLAVGLFDQARQRADEAAVLDARRRLSEVERTFFDPENPESITAARGRNALGLPEKVLPKFQAAIAEIEKSLVGPQRDAFRNISLRNMEQFEGRVQQHVFRESENFLAATEQASLADISQRASTAAREGRMSDMDGEIGLAHAQLELQGQRRGLPAEAIKLAKDQFTSASLVSAVEGMLNTGDYRGAADFFRANLGQMQESDRGRIDNAVRNAELLIVQTDKANEIMGRFGTSDRAFSEAQKIEDPVLRDRVTSIIDRQAAAVERAARAADRANLASAYEAVFQADPGQGIEQVVQPGVLARLDPQAVLALDQFQKRRLSNTATVTDPREFERLAVLPPEELAEVDVNGLFVQGKLSVRDRDHWLKRQGDILNPKEDKAPSFASEAQMLEESFAVMGWQTKGKRNEKERGAFRVAFFEAERARARELGRTLTDDEKFQVINQLQVQLVRTRPGFFFDRTETRRAFEVPEDEISEFNIPPSTRQMIVETFQSEGVNNPTEEQIRRVFIGNSERFNRLNR